MAEAGMRRREGPAGMVGVGAGDAWVGAGRPSWGTLRCRHED